MGTLTDYAQRVIALLRIQMFQVPFRIADMLLQCQPDLAGLHAVPAHLELPVAPPEKIDGAARAPPAAARAPD